MPLWIAPPQRQLAVSILCFLLFALCCADGALDSFGGESSATYISSGTSDQDIEYTYNTTSSATPRPWKNSSKKSRHFDLCPSRVDCWKLGGECVRCEYNLSCVYGETVTVKCEPNHHEIDCLGSRSFNRSLTCRYCYQTESWEHLCTKSSTCRVVSNPRERYIANCTARSNVLCMGNRSFPKYVDCNLTSGYKWRTALVLSVFVGGFGADRFYLGHWQEGIGKLFSFGGLGVWTILDVILIGTGYLGPADGSLYMS